MSLNYFSSPIDGRDLSSFEYSSCYSSKESASLAHPSYLKPTVNSSFRPQKLDSSKFAEDSHLTAPWSPESKPPSFSPQYLPVNEKTIQYREQHYHEFDMFSLGEAATQNNHNLNLEDAADADVDAEAEGTVEFDFSQLAQESVLYPAIQLVNHPFPRPTHSRSNSHSSSAPAPFNISIEQAESHPTNSHDAPRFIHYRHHASFSSQTTDDESRNSEDLEGGEPERDELDETGSVVDLDFNLRFNEEHQDLAKRHSAISPMLPATAHTRSTLNPTASLCVPNLWQRRAVQRSNSASIPSTVSHQSSTMEVPPPQHKLRIQTTGGPHFLNPHSPLSSPSSPVSPSYSPRSSTSSSCASHMSTPPFSSFSSTSSDSSTPMSTPPFSSSNCSTPMSTPPFSSSNCSTPPTAPQRKDFDQYPRIGTYTPMERALKIQRYHEKRQRRQWGKKILYGCRKSFADKRPRVGGRFVKMAPGSARTVTNTTATNPTTKTKSVKGENDDCQGNE